MRGWSPHDIGMMPGTLTRGSCTLISEMYFEFACPAFGPDCLMMMIWIIRTTLAVSVS